MIKLKSKAQNLITLEKVFSRKNIIIPKFFYLKKNEFYKNKKFYIKKIKSFIKRSDVILRSSALSEDSSDKSQAGKYDSQIIPKKKFDKLESIIISFLKQFKKKDDEIIIQYLIKNVDVAGVIFTKDSKYNSPYYLINYDKSGSTNLITSGARNDTKKQIVIYKDLNLKNKFKSLLDACKVLEKKINNDRLDIEFAYKKKKLFLFQVRPLPKTKIIENKNLDTKIFPGAMINIEKKLNKLMYNSLNISGSFTIFSNMSDWNPAEMIGDKPNPLALSLYKELITDEVWRDQRFNYGFKDVFPNVLMFSFAGSPFIDLRTDINSFLPKKLNKKICEKIVNKYLSILKKKPELHDKIEFNLIETCFSFGSQERLKQHFDNKTINEYVKELKILTNNIIKGNFLKTELEKLKNFNFHLENIEKKKISPIQKIYFLTKIIKNYGTLPFAGIARMAFISQIILLDLKKIKLISESEFENFFKSLKLINSNIFHDHNKVIDKKLAKALFLKKYGHIRPSTYDINSLNYKENYKNYFSRKKSKTSNNIKNLTKFKNSKKLNQLFLKTYNIKFIDFLKFAKQTITNREYSKFVFSQGINKIFENLIILSKEINIPRSDLCYLDIKNILNLYSKLESRKLKGAFLEEIKDNKKEFNFLKTVKLPDVIKTKNDIYQFEESQSKVNFITTKKIIGLLAEIDLKKIKKSLNDKIILIKNADPGYDFIFNYKIRGLVTMYGGSNSHMAIRCLEQNIPAAIGIGKLNYEEILKKEKLLLDCSKEKLYTIN